MLLNRSITETLQLENGDGNLRIHGHLWLLYTEDQSFIIETGLVQTFFNQIQQKILPKVQDKGAEKDHVGQHIEGVVFFLQPKIADDASVKIGDVDPTRPIFGI
jgi:hypothetical protein